MVTWFDICGCVFGLDQLGSIGDFGRTDFSDLGCIDDVDDGCVDLGRIADADLSDFGCATGLDGLGLIDEFVCAFDTRSVDNLR